MKPTKWLLGAALILVAASVLSRSFTHPGKNPDQDKEEGEAIRTPSRVSTVNGKTVITLDAATQKRVGITVAELRAVSAQQKITATGMVLAVQDLVALKSAYIAARLGVEKAQASLDVSQKEYKRLEGLYKDNQNISKKSLEAAEGLLRADQATLNASRQQLENAESAVRTTWGPRVANWTANDSPTLGQLLNLRRLPVEVTLPPGSAFTNAPLVELTAPDGATLHASYVSSFPRVDPRIQGLSLLYLAPAHPGLGAGTTMVAHLPIQRRRKGVLVPASAVVWWQGQAWAYEQTSATQFTRRPVPTGEPLDRGYFVTQGLHAGSKIVEKGAQDLLSEEFRTEIQPED